MGTESEKPKSVSFSHDTNNFVKSGKVKSKSISAELAAKVTDPKQKSQSQRDHNVSEKLKSTNTARQLSSNAESTAKLVREAVTEFDKKLTPMLARQKEILQRQLTGNSTDDCQNKQQAAIMLSEATVTAVQRAQKLHDLPQIVITKALRAQTKARFEPFAHMPMASALLELAKARHALGFLELRSACKTMGHCRKPDTSKCVLARGAVPSETANPSRQTGRAPHKATEHIKRLKEGAKKNPILRFSYPLYNNATYAIGQHVGRAIGLLDGKQFYLDDTHDTDWRWEKNAKEGIMERIAAHLCAIGAIGNAATAEQGNKFTQELAQCVWLLDLLLTIHEYKLCEKYAYPNCQNDVKIQAAVMTKNVVETPKSLWGANSRNGGSLRKLVGKRHIKS